MRALLTFLMAGGLVAVVAVAAGLLLPACGAQRTVWPTWLTWCPINQQAQADAQLAALTDRNAALEALIQQRERALGLLQCEPQTAALPPPRPPVPEAIEREDWEAQDLGLLEGCWQLDSTFTTVNETTGVRSRYTEWEMCFDASGNGREEMRSDTGSVCAGAVTSTFDTTGRLRIVQPGNLQCSDGAFIFRMESACTLNPNGTASCAVSQPESGGAATIEFRRAGR